MKQFIEKATELLELPKVNARQYSPLALAFIGDSIYDLIIRTKIVSKANAPVNKLHLNCSKYVKASAQAKIIRFLEPILTKDEHSVYKRGRNAKSFSVPKNASLADYRNATGFEALMGYLYLEGELERLMELIMIGIKEFEKEED